MVLVAGAMAGTGVAAGEPPALFPSPLHLTREVSDSLSGKIDAVDEYCLADRVVSVSRDRSRVVIADYAKNQLTEIDRRSGTWSVTPFQLIAAAGRAMTSRPAQSSSQPLQGTMATTPPRSIAGRMGDVFEVTLANGEGTVTITLDRTMRLSRPAIEVLTGSAYPSTPGISTAAVFTAAGSPDGPVSAQSTSNAEQIGLPLEIVIRFDRSGQHLQFRNSIVRVGSEFVPPDLLAVPAGSRLVESNLVKAGRALHEMDALPDAAVKP
ncbi:MAG: hypothetical protein ABI718_00035 [Acidobacteriota bacterium]